LPNLSDEQFQTLFEEWQERDAAKRAKDWTLASDVIARAGDAADVIARHAKEKNVEFLRVQAAEARQNLEIIPTLSREVKLLRSAKF
jgi:hypothetical protein